MKKSIVTIALALGARPALAQSTCPDFTAHELYECPTPTDSTSIDKFSVESNKLIRMSYLVDGRVESFVRKTNCKPTRAQ